MSNSVEERKYSPESGVELWDDIDVFPGSDFGAETKEDFINSILESIAANPDNVHIILTEACGPGEGKTLETLQLGWALVKPDGPVRTLAKQLGKKIIISSVEWGDAYEVIPEEEVIKDNYLYDLVRWQKKRAEVEKASENWKEGMVRTIQGLVKDEDGNWIESALAKDHDVIHIVLGDILATGLVSDWVGEDLIGIPRGYKETRDLVKHEGIFKDLPYNLFMQAIVAESDIVENAIIVRHAAEVDDKETLKKHGLSPSDSAYERDRVRQYFAASASPTEIEAIQAEFDKLASELFNREILTPDREEQYGYGFPFSEQIFGDRHTERVLYKGQKWLPLYLANLGWRPKDNRVIVLYNDTKLDEITPYWELPDQHPLQRPKPQAA